MITRYRSRKAAQRRRQRAQALVCGNMRRGTMAQYSALVAFAESVLEGIESL